MSTERQLSIGFLLWETFWVGIALSSALQVANIASEMGAMAAVEGDRMKALICFPLLMLTVIAGGAAIGGLCGSMRLGALIGLGIGLLLFVVPCGTYALIRQ